MQKRVAKGWQHEEYHLTSSESEIRQAQELGVRRVKIVTGSALTGAGIGLLVGTTASPELASTARTLLGGVGGLIEGLLAGQLISHFVCLGDPCERKARKAEESVEPEILEIFKVTREE